MEEINKLSLIRDLAVEIKKLPETVSSSFNNYLKGKYDLDDLQEKADHPEWPRILGSSEAHNRQQLAC
jgi:hypothetical protein